MLEMIHLSPLNMSLIFATMMAGVLGAVWGWRHSAHTRKLIRFALLLLLVITLLLLIFNRLFPPVSSYVVINP